VNARGPLDTLHDVMLAPGVGPRVPITTLQQVSLDRGVLGCRIGVTAQLITKGQDAAPIVTAVAGDV
jgi:hypothetical protein